jgi:flagellar basal-body rod protein FlgB
MPAFELLSTPALQAGRLALEAAQLRQIVIAANIANADSPGYLPRRVDFEARLQAALAEAGEATDIARIAMEARPIVVAESAALAPDQQLAAQMVNSVHYQALLKSINAQLDLLNLASNDGRK